MKKLILVIASFILALALISCTPESDPSDQIQNNPNFNGMPGGIPGQQK